MGVSTMFSTGKKNNLAFGYSKSPGNKFLRPFECKYEYCIFLYELFSFYEKVPSTLDHACFSSKYFYAPHYLQP